MTLSTDTTALQIIRMINAPCERVYAAWTDPDLARLWWGADGCSTDELVLDVWRGGRFRWVARPADGEKLTIEGKFRVVRPYEKIVHTWQWVENAAWKDALSLVTVEFLEKEDNTVTEVRLTHDKLPDEQSRDNRINEWNNALDRLEHLLAVPA
ncbi:SRPBCC domain-containing protein [Prosthecobacter sp.]|uniref:SRPBCC domain-containing protein n=1 Tax=Prosthecobacter sp. TaxID=1965333 RepID=UPI0037850348